MIGDRLLMPHGTKWLLELHILIPAYRKEKGAENGKGVQNTLPLTPQ